MTRCPTGRDGSRVRLGYRDRDYHIYVMDADGSDQTRLADHVAAAPRRDLRRPGLLMGAASRSFRTAIANIIYHLDDDGDNPPMEVDPAHSLLWEVGDG